MVTRPTVFGDDPNNIQATVSRAMTLQQGGQLGEAERLYKSVLAASPNHFEALHFLGLLEAQRDRFAEADRLMSRSLQVNSQVPEAFANHARVLNALKRSHDALAACAKALAINPRSIEALVSRGNALKDIGQFQPALASYDQALVIRPGYFTALAGRGNVLLLLKRYEEALVSVERALALRPAHVEALNDRGQALHALKRYEEALASYDRALAIKPDFAEALNNRGNTLHELNRYHEALASFDRAVAIRGEYPESYFNRANALLELGRCAEALALYDQTVLTPANEVDVLNCRGLALLALGRHEEARECVRRALLLDPSHIEVLRNESYMNLTLGRLSEGWDQYDHRFGPGGAAAKRPYPQPRWNGQAVPGTLLIWSEQGLGDQIIYASMVPDLVGRAEKIVLEVEPRLVDLFARSFPGVDVRARANELYSGPIHAQEPIGSIGRYLRRDEAAFPHRPSGFLVPDAARVSQLRHALGNDGRRIVGLSWGSKNQKYEQVKTAALMDFAPVLRMPGCRFVNLQYGDTRAECEALERDLGVRVERIEDVDNTRDIDGLAALMCACDFVVSVSNTNAHLAGALGRPTWVFAPFGISRIWYWFLGRSDSPWYPRVTIRHQASGQPWADLIASAANDISSAVSSVETRQGIKI